tara:strand:- start:1354 stop:2250 length:897 start_codon:yes stop_codon:yes gene_type:complete
MRLVIYLILIFGLIKPSFGQEVFVKQVWGNVEFHVDEKKTIVKDFSSFTEKTGVFILKDKNSQLFIRIGDKLDVLDFSEEKYKYPLKELIAPKQDLEKPIEGFLDKYFSLFSVLHDDEVKINGMMVAEKSAVLRGDNDINVTEFKPIPIIESCPFKIDFSDQIGQKYLQDCKYKIVITDHYTNDTISNIITEQTFCLIDVKNKKVSRCKLEISIINTAKKISGSIELLHLTQAEKESFNQLKAKAIAESKTDESIYQIIFVESLRAIGLSANASYYLDLFIETNNHPKLVNYKDHYTK